MLPSIIKLPHKWNKNVVQLHPMLCNENCSRANDPQTRFHEDLRKIANLILSFQVKEIPDEERAL